jgi:hypothetical protein
MVFGMGGKIRRLGFALALTSTLALASAASSAAATSVGSVLTAVPNSEACGFGMFTATDRPCTSTQATLAANQTAAGGLVSPIDGVVVNWTVRSGPATPDTTRVRLRPRTLRGEVGGAAGTMVDLPLGAPGLHTFAERMPIKVGEGIGVTALVTNQNNGSAGAPILRFEPGIGTVSRFETALPEGSTTFLNEQSDSELMLNAQIEPDADHDGFGDETQDRCPTDPLLQGPCRQPGPERQPPQTKVTYANRQDFIAKKKVVVRLRSSEAGTVSASGQLEIPSKHAIWGLYGAKSAVGAGERVTLRLRLPGNTLRAARRALANGRKVRVKVTLSAADAAGNDSGSTVATIKPPRG